MPNHYSSLYKPNLIVDMFDVLRENIDIITIFKICVQSFS